MALVIGDFATNLTATLNAITSSKIYTDIKEMYDDGTFQKDQYDKVLIGFHEKALSMAGSVAENFTIKGYRIDEILQADLDDKAAQKATEAERKNLIIAQTRGFDDNVSIERVKIAAESIGMIQSGGNTAPQSFFDEWTNAIIDLKTISKKHTELPQV